MRERESAITSSKRIMGRIGNRPYWVLCFSIGVRAGHQLGAAVFITAYLFEGFGPPPFFFLWLVSLSGVVLVFSEWMRHRELFREFAGAVTFVKLVIIGAAFHGLLPVKAAIIAGFILASIGSHLPKQIRHRLLY